MKYHLLFAFALAVQAAAAAGLPEFRFDATKSRATGREAGLIANKNITCEVKEDFLEATTVEPARRCDVSFKLDLPYDPRLLLVFEYRCVMPEDKVASHLTASFADDRRNNAAESIRVGRDRGWQRAVFKLGAYRVGKTRPFEPEARLRRLNLTSRLISRDSPCPMTLQVRHLRFEIDPDYDPLEGVRVSYSLFPLFDWQESAEDRSYRFEYAADPAFPVPGTRSATTTVPYFVPDKHIAPGAPVYFRVTGVESGKLLANDRLRIADRAQSWRRAAIDWAAYAARPRPRLLELARATNPDPAALLARAEKYLALELAPNPGLYQAGADPEIRSWVEWYGQVAGNIIGRTGIRIGELAQAAMLTGREDFRTKAKELALGVSRTWDPEGGSNVRQCDLACSNLLRGLCFAYDAAAEIMTEPERRELAATIRVRAQQFWAWTHPFASNEAGNHSWDRAQAVAFAAATLPDEPDAEMKFTFVADLFAYRFLPSLGFEGENNEGLRYWSFGFNLAVRFVDLARYAVGLDFYSQPWLRQTCRFPMYSLPPGGYGVSFADSGRPNHGYIGPMNRPFTAKLAAAAGDGAALWYAGIAEAGGTPAVDPVTEAPSKFYAHLGIGIFNTFLADGRENVQVGFHSGKFFAGHQHADQNSFVINAYGDKLAVDGGYYDWFGSRHFRAYSNRTEAHNSVLVNGQGQAVMTPGADGRTTGFFDSPNFGYQAGDGGTRMLYHGELKRFDRQILFVKPDYFFTFDQLAAPKAATFSYLLLAHTEQPFPYDNASGRFSIVRPLARLDGAVLLPKTRRGAVAAAYTVMPTLTYSETVEPEPQPEWRLTVDNAEPMPETEFLAAMRIGRAGEAAAEAEWTLLEAGPLVGARSGEVLVLFHRRPGELARLENIATDARAAAVRFAEGRIVDAMFVGGTRLQVGERHFTRSERGDFALKTERALERRPAEGLLTLDDRAVPATLYAETLGDGSRVYQLSGVVELPAARTVTLSTAPADRPRHLIFGSAANYAAPTLEAGAATLAGVELPAGKTIISVSAAVPPGVIALK